MKLSKKLSPAIVEAAKPEAEPYRLWDTVVPQLHLRVQPSGIKTWNVQWSRTSSKSLGKWPGVTVESARTKAREILAETDRHGAPVAVVEARKPAAEKPITFGDYITDHFTPWAKVNQKAWRATLDNLQATFGHLYNRELRSLDHAVFDKFKNARVAAGIEKSTVNRDLSRVRKVFAHAIDNEFLSVHPLRKVKAFPARDADKGRVRYLSDDEEARLRATLAAREVERRASRTRHNAWHAERGTTGHPQWGANTYTDHLMPMVLLAINTGMRRGELFGLDWSHVKLSAKLLTVVAGNAKSGKARHIPLNAEAVEVLKRWKPGTGLVFPSPKTGGRMDNINNAWEALAEAAQLVEFRFHDLRHHFASKLVMAGVDLNTVRELLGHADIAMTLRYAHLAPHKLADAVAKLGR